MLVREINDDIANKQKTDVAYSLKQISILRVKNLSVAFKCRILTQSLLFVR